MVELDAGEMVLQRGEQVDRSLFPFGPTMISLVVELSGGRSVEVASIGREGAVGGIVSCGHAPAFSRAEVLVGGPALARADGRRSRRRRAARRFIGNIFCRFSDYLLVAGHAVGRLQRLPFDHQRAARWLLHAQDRAGDRIELTQEALAGLLGVQRTTVNAVVRSSQAEGLIATGRGIVGCSTAAGLKRRACECYERLEEHFGAVIGPSGIGRQRGLISRRTSS